MTRRLALVEGAALAVQVLAFCAIEWVRGRYVARARRLEVAELERLFAADQEGASS